MWRRLSAWVLGSLTRRSLAAHRLRMRKRQNAHVATQGSVCLH
jgi:hypothetical protein